MTSQTRTWSLFTTACLLITGGWILLTAIWGPATTQGQTPAPRQGFLAPDFTLESSTGEPLRLSQFRGKAVVLNIWASWCPPCKAEMPSIQQAYIENQSNSLVVLAVNSTIQDDQITASQFVQQQGLTFPILWDTQGEVSRLYQVQALPTTFFIRPDGIIDQIVIGGPISEPLLRVNVQKLLSGVTQ